MNRKTIIVALFGLLIFAGQNALADSGSDLFQKGLVQERVKGDLDAAIKIYDRIIARFPDDRPVAAKALLHIGLCYEKLGKQEAQKHYQHLIKDYADQVEAVRIARQHLEQLAPKSAVTKVDGPTYRIILDGKIGGMPVRYSDFSPSGDRVVFISENKLYISDQTGTMIRPLLDDLGTWEGASRPLWSPDGKLIAYTLWKKSPPDSETWRVTGFFVINPDGGTPRQIGGSDMGFLRFWTHDSRSLSFSRQDGLHTIGLDGNEIRFIAKKDLSEYTMWSSNATFSSDRRWIVYNRGLRDGMMNEGIFISPIAGGEERLLIKTKERGPHPAWAPDGRALYYVTRSKTDYAGGNIWKLPMDPETGLATGEPRQISFFNNARITSLKVLGDGDKIVIRMYKRITSIQVADAESPREARALVQSAPHMPQLSPDGQTVYYVNRTPDGKGIYAIARQGGAARRLAEGILGNGGRTPSFDLSQDGRTLAYGAKRGTEQGILTLPTSGGEPHLLVKTSDTPVPQWSPDGSSIAYVVGKSLYVIPKAGGKPRQVANLKELMHEWTARWSPDGKFLAVIGSNEKFPKNESNAVFVVPASGGVLKQLTPYVDGWVEGLEWRPDGKRLSYHGYLEDKPHDSVAFQTYLDGRPPSMVCNAPDFWDYIGNWAPDNRRFFFVASGPGWGLHVYDEVSGKSTGVSDHTENVSVPTWSGDGKTMAWWETRKTPTHIWIMENFNEQDDADE